LLGAAILMEIPISMVLLSRVLKYGANRWANMIAGAIMTAVQFSSLFFGSSPTIYYIFFSILEIACTALIVWYAWKWANPESSPRNKI
jgi:threonine/homoserine/homoserine lactone efflux protein